MTDNEIKVVREKIESLHDKILKSKFAETVTESEMLSLIFAVRGLNDQKAEIERLEEILGGTSKVLTETCAVVRAEAIKEFLSKARELSYKSSDWSHGEHPFVVEWDDLETICEEMVGVRDDERQTNTKSNKENGKADEKNQYFARENG